MAAALFFVVLAIVASASDVDASVGGSGFRRSDFKASPRGNSGQRFVGAASSAVGPISADEGKAVSVGSTGSLRAMPGILPDEVMDPAFGFSASRQVLAKIKAEAPARREKWLKGTVELKSAAVKSRAAAADYENKMTKLDATVAMADQGVVHLRQDISNEHVRNANKIREHLKSMKKDVSTQLARAAVAGSPVEHSPYENVDARAANMQSEAQVGQDARVEEEITHTLAGQHQDTHAEDGPDSMGANAVEQQHKGTVEGETGGENDIAEASAGGKLEEDEDKMKKAVEEQRKASVKDEDVDQGSAKDEDQIAKKKAEESEAQEHQANPNGTLEQM